MAFGDGQAGNPPLDHAGPADGRLDGEAVRPMRTGCGPLELTAHAGGHLGVTEPADGPCADREVGGGSVRLEAAEENVSRGRRWLREQLGRRFGHDHPAVTDVLQAFSEVLTNAVMHGAGRHVRIAWRIAEHGVVVEVYNGFGEGGPLPAKQDPADTYAESGRGLTLLEAYSDAWGTERTPGSGVKVWFSVGFARAVKPAAGAARVTRRPPRRP